MEKLGKIWRKEVEKMESTAQCCWFHSCVLEAKHVVVRRLVKNGMILPIKLGG